MEFLDTLPRPSRAARGESQRCVDKAFQKKEGAIDVLNEKQP